jgi:hypothetical protein
MIKINEAAISVFAPDPHCIVWVRCQASIWGHAEDHDLDEPVPLTDEVPLRLRYKDARIIGDRQISMKVRRSGTNTLLRCRFKDGSFIEVETNGVTIIPASATWADVSVA